jgi:hypothetical protein
LVFGNPGCGWHARLLVKRFTSFDAIERSHISRVKQFKITGVLVFSRTHEAAEHGKPHETCDEMLIGTRAGAGRNLFVRLTSVPTSTYLAV